MLKANTDIQLGMNVQDRQQIFASPHPDPEVPGTVQSVFKRPVDDGLLA
jgi:hypothetical protein